MSEKAKLSAPSSWVPQLFFDLIGRILPGGVILVLGLATIVAPEIHAFFSNPPIEAGFAASFLSLSIVMVVGTFASYVLAIIIWGVWYSGSLAIAIITGYRFEPETLVALSPDDFARRYETIKAADSTAGGRITKLKAEIHMSSTLIIGLVLEAILVFSTVGLTIWFVLVLISVWGAIGSLLHFRRRISEVLNYHPALLVGLIERV